MSKVLVNLLIIVILCFSLSMIPLDTRALDINFDNMFKSEDEEPEVVIEPITYAIAFKSDQTEYYNPNKIEVEFTASHKTEELDLLATSEFSIDVYEGQTKLKTINDTSGVITKTLSEDELTLIVETKISQEALDLENGSYDFVLNAAHEELSESIQITTYYLNDNYTYNKGTSDPGEATTPVRLHYLDKDMEVVVPVYRMASYSTKLTRNAFNALFDVPTDMGLNETAHVPYAPRIFFESGMATCHLTNASIVEFTKNDYNAPLAFEAIAKTMVNIENSFVTQKVQFLLNGKLITAVGETPVEASYEIKDDNQVFMPYVSADNRILLIPTATNKQEVTEVIDYILDALFSPDKYSINKRFIPALPLGVELVEYRIEGTNLKVVFNKGLYDAFDGNPAYVSMMIDALSLSFDSIKDIETTEIIVGGKTVTKIGSVKVASKITAPKYFNIE